MASPRANPERTLARLIAIDLALQALIERLLLAGSLDPSDLVAMRDFGLGIAAEMQEQNGTGVRADGARVGEEVRSFWGALGVPKQMGRISDQH